MKGYIEIQARRKAHELVVLAYRTLKTMKNNKNSESLKNSLSSLAAELYEAHGRLFDDEKIKHISKSRGYLYESKYYLNLLTEIGKLNKYTKNQLILKIDLLDKLLISMIKDRERYGVRV